MLNSQLSSLQLTDHDDIIEKNKNKYNRQLIIFKKASFRFTP